MQIELPDQTLFDVTLAPDLDPMLGEPVQVEEPIERRLRLGRIFTRKLTPETTGEDLELKAFVEADEDRFDYHVLRFTCTFEADRDAPIESAWIRMDLTHADENPNPDSQPVAWSLEPTLLSTPTGIVRRIDIQGPMKLMTYSKERVDPEDIYLQARYNGTSHPTWYLTRTEHRGIEGDHDLRATVRLPCAGEGLVRVGLGASVRRKIGRLIPYVALLTGDEPAAHARFGP